MEDEKSSETPLIQTEERSVNDSACSNKTVYSIQTEENLTKFYNLALIYLLFGLSKLALGYFSRSVAVMCDALHSISDFTGFAVSIIALKVSELKGENMQKHKRAEIIGKLSSAALSFGLTLWLAYTAIPRVFSPIEVEGVFMIVAAAVGLMLKMATAFVLLEKSVSSGTLDQIPEDVKDKNSLFHILAKTLQVIAILVLGALIYYVPSLALLDPIFGIALGIFIVYTAGKVTVKSISTLMKDTEKSMEAGRIESELVELEGLTEVSNLHLLSLSQRELVLTCHIEAPDSSKMLKTVSSFARRNYGVAHSTIQIKS